VCKASVDYVANRSAVILRTLLINVKLLANYATCRCNVYMSSNINLDSKAIRGFFDRNDLHIFINDKLFFGESTHPLSQISVYQTSFRLSDRSQHDLRESVLMYELHCLSWQYRQVFLSTKGIFKFFRRCNCLGLVIQEIV